MNSPAFDIGYSVGYGMGVLVTVAWNALFIVQVFLGYGTAYRLTKRGGDSGVALFGWLLVMVLASLVPGLGIWLYVKYKDA